MAQKHLTCFSINATIFNEATNLLPPLEPASSLPTQPPVVVTLSPFISNKLQNVIKKQKNKLLLPRFFMKIHVWKFIH